MQNYNIVTNFSDIDSDDYFITLTHLSVSDNDSIVYQPPTPAESHGTTPSASNTIVPPTSLLFQTCPWKSTTLLMLGANR